MDNMVLQFLLTHWQSILGTAVAGFLLPFLRSKGKAEIAKRYAMIAAAMAAEILQQYPTLPLAGVVDRVMKIIIGKWRLTPEVAQRIAAQAAQQAMAQHRVATLAVTLEGNLPGSSAN